MDIDRRIAERVAEQLAARRQRRAETAAIRAELDERRKAGLEERKRQRLDNINNRKDDES